MKNRVLLYTAFCALLSVTSAFAGNGGKFSIKGEFKELQKGDKIIFRRVAFPGFHLEKGFEITVAPNGKFSYKDTISDARLYVMSFIPATGEAPCFDRMGEEIVIRPNDNIILTGELDKIYFSKIRGGIYDNPGLQAAKQLTDSLGFERTLLSRNLMNCTNIEEANAANKAKEDYYTVNSELLKTSDSLMNAYMDSPHGEELSIINILQRINSFPYEKNKAAFDKLSESSKQSYHGMIAARELEKIDRLAIGKTAPSFTLTRSDSTKVTSGDFRGKHLLIYHWGMCPGSMQADPSVTALFNRTDRSGVMILGVTSGRKAVEELYKNISSDAIIYEMNAKERLHSMLNHPYEDFDLNIPGNDLDKLFAMGGLPYFVLISPDGKIIARGYHEALKAAQKQLLPPAE